MGSFTFIIYNIIIIFFALNIFFTILVESFSRLKSEANSNDEFEIVNYLFEKVERLIKRHRKDNSNEKVVYEPSVINSLPRKFDLLLHKLDKVRFKIFLKIFGDLQREKLKEISNLKLQLPNI